MKPYVICHICTPSTAASSVTAGRRSRVEKIAGSCSRAPRTASGSAPGSSAPPRCASSPAATSRPQRRRASGASIGPTTSPTGAHGASPSAPTRRACCASRSRRRGRPRGPAGQRAVGNDYLSHLRDAGVSYLFCGKDHVDVKAALDKIRRVLGIHRLYARGGGTFNGAVAERGAGGRESARSSCPWSMGAAG